MSKIISLILFFIFPILVFVTGLGDWVCETPYQNQIDNFHSIAILRLKNGSEIKYIENWVFDGKYILGNTKKENKKQYFIVNEINFEITIFDNYENWKQNLTQKNIDFVKLDWFSTNSYNNDFIWFFYRIPIILFVIPFIWLFYRILRILIEFKK